MKALHAGFSHLGYDHTGRDARLAAAAEALGQEQPLASFNDLTEGQAGFLIRWLGQGARPGELDHDAPSERMHTPTRPDRPAEPAVDPDAAEAIGVSIAALAGLLWLLTTLRRRLKRLPTRAAATSHRRPNRPGHTGSTQAAPDHATRHTCGTTPGQDHSLPESSLAPGARTVQGPDAAVSVPETPRNLAVGLREWIAQVDVAPERPVRPRAALVRSIGQQAPAAAPWQPGAAR